MEQNNDLQAMLDQLDSPAFFVREGLISAVNSSAKQRMAEIGMQVEQLLLCGAEEYSHFQNGSLYLTVSLGGFAYRCVVTKLAEQELFTIDLSSTDRQLQVLSLAASQLRAPLLELSMEINKVNSKDTEHSARLNQSLYRLQRIIGNMADTAELSCCSPNMQTQELCSVFEEVLQKAQMYLSYSDITVKYRLPQQPILCLADSQMLTRAVYNLLSNACKFSQPGSTVDITVNKINNKVYFTVCNLSDRIMHGNMFSRYTRRPGLEDPKFGLGLGMTLIHTVAAAHGGTVLIEQSQEKGTRVTFTVAIRKSTDTSVRTPILRPDAYGGRDQALVELSDVLPYSLYNL